LKGIPYGGRVRLLPVGAHRSLVASDAPLARYGDAALEQGIADLEWVSRVALAHERVIEAFLSVDAVLPMKLFTIFATDERAVAHVAASATELDLLARRVARRQEWGIRVVLANPTGRMSRPPAASARSGAAYLQHKKAVKDEAAKRAGQARAVVAQLFESLAAHATEARKRSNREIAAAGGSLLLDAALLVPRSGSSRFRAAAARHARALSSEGYTVALTGPWPPYSFMRD
jgi:hypothetical protein